jgi:DNA-binding MarR family transcriptional regulator
LTDDRYAEKRMGVLLRVPHRAVVSRIVERLAAKGYSDLQPAHMVIFQYVEHTGSRLTWLAERAQVTKQTMSYLVDYLEARGYVERIADPADRRAKLVRMTARGWAVHDLGFDIVDELEGEWAAQLGESPFKELKRLLGRLGEVVEAGNQRQRGER